jgi:hypothetical protein
MSSKRRKHGSGMSKNHSGGTHNGGCVSNGFFAIDRAAFRCAAVGGLNSAIALLVMARGTGPDNVTTQWSVNAIEKRTGISRPNADKAVKDLLARGIWKKPRDGRHPIYEAVPGNEIAGGPFTVNEQAIIAAIRKGNGVPFDAKAEAQALEARGIIREETIRHSNYKHSKSLKLDDAAIAALTEPFTIWLPNALIDGAAGEVPPIELIRQTRNLSALRLLIELYAVQFLPNYGGVPRELLRHVFERAKVGEQGPFVVWGFRSKHLTAGAGLSRPFRTGKHITRDDDTQVDTGIDSEFWPAVHALENLGLVERVGMLLDGDDDAAEVIHPYPMRDGEPAERDLAEAARLAALAMITDGQRDWAGREGYDYLVPVQRHIVHATVAEIYRLKYRPHTKATVAWYAEMQNSTTKHLERYLALIPSPAAAMSA